MNVRTLTDGSFVRARRTAEGMALDEVVSAAEQFRDEARAYTDSKAWTALDAALEKLRAVRS